MRTLQSLTLWLVCLPSVSPVSLAQQPPGPPPRVIEVTGNGEVKVAPDEVIVSAGVETYGDTLEGAKSANDERMRQILSVGQPLGIKSEDIQTSHASITPRYEFTQQTRFDRLLGYTCNKQVQFILRDPTRLDDLVTAVLNAGANELHGISFNTSQLRQHRDKAREMALIAAREKAEAMAAVLGAKIGKPLRISEQASSWFPPPMPMQNVMFDARGAGGGEAGSTFSLGQISVSAIVNVTFELE